MPFSWAVLRGSSRAGFTRRRIPSVPAMDLPRVQDEDSSDDSIGEARPRPLIVALIILMGTALAIHLPCPPITP